MKKSYFEYTSKKHYYYVFIFDIHSLLKFLSFIGNNDIQLYGFSKTSDSSFELVVYDPSRNLRSMILDINS